MTIFPDQGPREWTPRVKRTLLEVERLRALIPPELIKEIDPPEFIHSSLTGRIGKLVLKVQFRKWSDNVWVYNDGGISVETGIRDLLTGKVAGWEHLAGRWDGVWPPPKPVKWIRRS